MTRILLSCDGSPASSSALSWVAARALRATGDPDTVSIVPPDPGSRWASSVDEAAGLLASQVPRLRVELPRLRKGDERPSPSPPADLIVIGFDPRRAAPAVLPTAIRPHLLSRPAAPICFVPIGWEAAHGPVTVGVPDGDAVSAALEFAAAEARREGDALRLVHAWLMSTPLPHDPSALVRTPRMVMDEQRAVLSSARQWVSEHHPDLTTASELVRDSRSAALARFAARSSMLVLGAGSIAGTNGLLGSVAQDVLRRAACPVCIVPEPARVLALPR